MARGSKKIKPLFPIGGTSEPEKKTEEKEAKPQSEVSPKLDEKSVNQQVQAKQIKDEKVLEPPSKVEESSQAPAASVIEQTNKSPASPVKEVEELAQEEPVQDQAISEQRKPEVEIETPVEVRNQQPELEQETKKDHSPTAQTESDLKGKELLKFEKALREYEEELEIRPKKELVTNVPVPLPNPVYQKLKDLEPYFTLKQKGFIQKVITDATIKEVKLLIQEVETKKLKKLRK